MAEDRKESDAKRGEKMPESMTGPGLKDAFKVLSHASQEKLQSLTFKMGSKQAEILVHAMCLITMKKGQEALYKLQALSNNTVAKHLVENVREHQGHLEDFRVDNQPMLESQTETLTDLARIFQVLAKERLCPQSLRNRAYQAALCACWRTMNKEKRENQQLERLIREATENCGPEFITIESGQFSWGKTLKSCSILQGKESPAIPIKSSQGGSIVKTAECSSPSSLRTSSSNEMSFPSHLEVSASPTAILESQRVSKAMQELSLTLSQTCAKEDSPDHSVLLSGVQPQNNPVEDCINRSAAGAGNVLLSQPRQNHSPTLCSPYHIKAPDFVEVTEKSENNGSVTTKISHAKSNLNRSSTPTTLTGNNKSESATLENLTSISRNTSSQRQTKAQEKKEDEVEEEAQFFSFVILHAPEDAEVAERLQEKLEDLGICEGSTFSKNFLVPGKSKLRCVEDAIDNSAFTILLLSRNFNTQLQEIQTNTALMNSIENRHKYNSVIPLLPSKDRLPHEDMPRCLKIFVPLEENSRSFGKMAKMALAPEKIKRQKQLWSQDQNIRTQREKKLRLKEEIKRSKDLAHEEMEVSQLEKEQMQFFMKLWHQHQQQKAFQYSSGTDSKLVPPYNVSCPPMQNLIDVDRQPSILISNASYVMIGNNSTMCVDISSEKGDDATDDLEE